MLKHLVEVYGCSTNSVFFEEFRSLLEILQKFQKASRLFTTTKCPTSFFALKNIFTSYIASLSFTKCIACIPLQMSKHTCTPVMWWFVNVVYLRVYYRQTEQLATCTYMVPTRTLLLPGLLCRYTFRIPKNCENHLLYMDV